jgi:hypothetical protein
LKVRPWSKYTPSHFTSSLDSIIIPSDNIIVASLVSFDVMKWISYVLARSNCIVFSEASLYIILISCYNILVFFRRLVDFVVIEISFIYEMYLTRLELVWGVSNRLRIYIRKRIGEIGFP